MSEIGERLQSIDYYSFMSVDHQNKEVPCLHSKSMEEL